MMSHLGLKSWQCKICGFNTTTKPKALRHLAHRHKDSNPENVLNLGIKVQLNFSDFKQPLDPKVESPAKVLYHLVDTDIKLDPETEQVF